MGSTRGAVEVEKLVLADVALCPAYRSDHRRSNHDLALNTRGDRVLDLGVVVCPYGVSEMESKYGKKDDAPKRSLLLTLDDAAKKKLKGLETRACTLVKYSLTADAIDGRAVEADKPLFSGDRPCIRAGIEYGLKRKRTTKFYDRRPGVVGRLSEIPPEIEYEELVNPDGTEPLRGCSLHAFVELSAWIDYDIDNKTVTFGITFKTFQVSVVKNGVAGGTGPAALDSSRPIPVTMQRLLELGISYDHDCGSLGGGSPKGGSIGVESLEDGGEGKAEPPARRVRRRSGKRGNVVEGSDDDGDCD